MYLACSSVSSVRWASKMGRCKLATYSSEENGEIHTVGAMVISEWSTDTLKRGSPIFLGRRYTSCLYRPTGALNNSIRARACRGEKGHKGSSRKTATVREATTNPTWVVAVMDNTKVGTVEQLRFRRRPWDMRAQKILSRLKNQQYFTTYSFLKKTNKHGAVKHLKRLFSQVGKSPLRAERPSFHRAKWCGQPESAPSPRSAQGCAGSPGDTNKRCSSHNCFYTRKRKGATHPFGKCP